MYTRGISKDPKYNILYNKNELMPVRGYRYARARKKKQKTDLDTEKKVHEKAFITDEAEIIRDAVLAYPDYPCINDAFTDDSSSRIRAL